MREPSMVEIIDGIHTVEQSPVDGWDLEGYIIVCARSSTTLTNSSPMEKI